MRHNIKFKKIVPFIFVSNTKKDQEKLFINFKLFKPSLKILIINGGNINTEPCKRFLEDPEKECLNYDILMWNSSLSTGVSIKLKTNYFKYIFAIFKNKIHINQTTTYLQNIQSISRYRNVVPIYLFITDEKVSKQENKLNHSKMHLDNYPSYKVHNDIVDEYLKFYNHNTLNYYSIHRSYLNGNGYSSEILYYSERSLQRGEDFNICTDSNILYQLRNYHLLNKPGRANLKLLSPLNRESVKILNNIFNHLNFDLNTLNFNNNFIMETKLKGFRDYISTPDKRTPVSNKIYTKLNNNIFNILNAKIRFRNILHSDSLTQTQIDNNRTDTLLYIIYFFKLINVDIVYKEVLHHGYECYRFTLPS